MAIDNSTAGSYFDFTAGTLNEIDHVDATLAGLRAMFKAETYDEASQTHLRMDVLFENLHGQLERLRSKIDGATFEFETIVK